MTYSIAIRTLGLSGDKFRRELESITRQTIQPERVVVYIAEGYERPEFQIGREEYIWVPKGMVAQRALLYEEITSDNILLLDDDVELAPDSAAILLQAMAENHADVIGADTFRNQEMNWRGKLFAALTNWVTPHYDQRWAFKVNSHGSFSYLSSPRQDCYPSQSCAGPASMWRKDVLLSLHLQDEMFLDQLGFSFGDDFLEFYKVHLNGYKLFIHYNCGIEHLDAKSSSAGYHSNINKFYVRSKGSFILWWRGCYEPSQHKVWVAQLYWLKVVWLLLVNVAASLWARNPKVVWFYIKGVRDGWKVMHSAQYLQNPPFLAHRRPRLLHVITSLRTGGAEKLMVDLLPRLRECGYDVELCVFDGIRTPFTEQLEQAGVRVHGLSHSMYSLANVWRLLPLMQRADIVHTHNTPCQFAAALLAPLCRCRVVTTEHNTSNRRRGKWYWRWMDRMMYARFDGVVCISPATKENLIQHTPTVRKKAIVVYNGIDTGHVKHSSAQNLKAPVPEGRYKIGMVAAFRHEKDQMTLIRAMKYLTSDYHLYFIGGGETSLISENKHLADSLQLSDRVHFLGIREDVPAILKSLDIVAQSSHVDGFCLAAVEAMAAGRPVLASDIDGLRDVVGGAGLLCPHGDAEAFASAIRRLTEDKAYAAQVAQACQERAAQYDISKMVEGYHRVYQSL